MRVSCSLVVGIELWHQLNFGVFIITTPHETVVSVFEIRSLYRESLKLLIGSSLVTTSVLCACVLPCIGRREEPCELYMDTRNYWTLDSIHTRMESFYSFLVLSEALRCLSFLRLGSGVCGGGAPTPKLDTIYYHPGKYCV